MRLLRKCQFSSGNWNAPKFATEKQQVLGTLQIVSACLLGIGQSNPWVALMRRINEPNPWANRRIESMGRVHESNPWIRSINRINESHQRIQAKNRIKELNGHLYFIQVEETVINRKSSGRRTGFCTGGEIYTVFHEEYESEVKNLQFFDLEAKN